MEEHGLVYKMNKRITYSIALALVLVLSIASVSAGILDWFKEKQEITKPKIDSLITMNVSDKVFTIKKTDLDKSYICLKDSQDTSKVVKIKKCSKDKTKYSLIDISDSNYFHSNTQGLVRFTNNG